MRLRGLKSSNRARKYLSILSKPMRLRGLKWQIPLLHIEFDCRSLCGFVDWNVNFPSGTTALSGRSLCGFVDWNSSTKRSISSSKVEAYAASWIEMCFCLRYLMGQCVEAYAASWIEIFSPMRNSSITLVEAYAASWIEIDTLEVWTPICLSRSLCGFVDWNHFAGDIPVQFQGRSLCSFVDWNKHDQGIGGQAVFVESNATSWIELD